MIQSIWRPPGTVSGRLETHGAAYDKAYGTHHGRCTSHGTTNGYTTNHPMACMYVFIPCGCLQALKVNVETRGGNRISEKFVRDENGTLLRDKVRIRERWGRGPSTKFTP